MTHPDDLVLRALDGDLTPNERQTLEAHLAGCRACRAVLADQRRAEASLRALEQLEPAADFAWRVVGRLPAPRRATLSLGRAALLLLLAGAAAVVLAWSDFLALAAALPADLEGLSLWALGEAPPTGWLQLNVDLALVIGLCLLGAASMLVLAQQSEGQ